MQNNGSLVVLSSALEVGYIIDPKTSTLINPSLPTNKNNHYVQFAWSM